MDKTTIRQLVGNKFFTVNFTKSDGSNRVMNARLGVKKYLKGNGKLSNTANISNMLTVFDMKIKQYRTVNLDNITSLVFKGKKYTIQEIK